MQDRIHVCRHDSIMSNYGVGDLMANFSSKFDHGRSKHCRLRSGCDELAGEVEEKKTKENSAKRGKITTAPTLPNLVEARLTRLPFRACCVLP